MKSKIVIGILSLLVFSLILLSGCGSDSNKKLAVVGDHEILLDEYDEYIRNLGRSYPSAQAEFDQKREALDTLIATHLLIQAAYEKGIDKHEEVARAVLANRPKFLLSALYDKHIQSKVNVTDADLRDFYNKLEFKLNAYQVLVNDPDTAQMLFERLKNGADFEQVAFEYSTDPSAKRNRGEIGYFLWGAMVDEFQEAAFAMEVGEISPPVKSDFGFHIIKLISKTKNEARTTFDEMKENIEQQIIRRRTAKLSQDYVKMILDKYPITVDESACDYLVHKREQLYPPQLLKNIPKSDFDVEQLDRNERELVFATWEGGTMSVMQYLSALQGVPQHYRPDLDDYDSVAVLVFSLLQTDILAYEAVVEGLESDENFKKDMARYKDLVMAEMMKTDSLPKPVEVDEATMRKYYEENQSEFSNPAQVHIYEILLSDELKAKNLAQTINSFKEFKEKAMDLTERPGKRKEEGDMKYIIRKYFPEIFDVAWKTPVGGIGGPVLTSGRYSIFYVVDKKNAELKDFLGQKRFIYQKLTSERAIETYKNWLEDRKAKTNIEINEDVLWATIDQAKYVTLDTLASANN